MTYLTSSVINFQQGVKEPLNEAKHTRLRPITQTSSGLLFLLYLFLRGGGLRLKSSTNKVPLVYRRSRPSFGGGLWGVWRLGCHRFSCYGLSNLHHRVPSVTHLHPNLSVPSPDQGRHAKRIGGDSEAKPFEQNRFLSYLDNMCT